MLKTTKERYKCIAGAVVYNLHVLVTRCAPWKLFVQSYTCVTVHVLVLQMYVCHTSSKRRCTVFPHTEWEKTQLM